MKQLFIILILFVTTPMVYAQNKNQDDEIQTIFSKQKSNGGYGAFTMSYSQIGGQNGMVTGGRGAFIFDHSFAIGLGGFGFVNNLDYNANEGLMEFSLAGGYGGLFFEPIVAGKSPVHVSFPILLGMGGVTAYKSYNWNWDSFDRHPNYGEDMFFVVEPAVDIEFNMTRFFRLAANVSYRFTSKLNLIATDEYALNGFNFGPTFKFGKF